MMIDPRETPALYLIPVPLSLETAIESSLPAENAEILRKVSNFIVENVRSARRFLKKCCREIDIDSLTFTVLDEHTDPSEVPSMLAPLEHGESIGIISEAGCPAVADPGADAVAEAQRRGYRVVPLVGPSSIIMSLMASGFNGQSFAFNGYLPIEAKARAAKFREMERRIHSERQTQIFIETPYRNNRLIEEICHSLPGTMLLSVSFDLTGPRESTRTMPLAKWAKTTYDYSKTPAIFLLFA